MAAAGAEVCVPVTLLDGLVLARSAFHHSMNYRSVVLLGTATKVEDVDEKRRAFDVIVDHVLSGRSEVARPASDGEVRTMSKAAMHVDYRHCAELETAIALGALLRAWPAMAPRLRSRLAAR